MPPEQDPDFILFWQTLCASSSALASYGDSDRLRGFKLADLREAMAQAFRAGKESR